MYLNVENGFANHRNEVSGRFGSGNGSGGDLPFPTGLSSASFSFRSSSSISTFPFLLKQIKSKMKNKRINLFIYS